MKLVCLLAIFGLCSYAAAQETLVSQILQILQQLPATSTDYLSLVGTFMGQTGRKFNVQGKDRAIQREALEAVGTAGPVLVEGLRDMLYGIDSLIRAITGGKEYKYMKEPLTIFRTKLNDFQAEFGLLVKAELDHRDSIAIAQQKTNFYKNLFAAAV